MQQRGKDRKGNFDAFQLEYLERNKSKKDIARYMESLKELDSFKERLSNVVKEFDVEWNWPEYSGAFMYTKRLTI